MLHLSQSNSVVRKNCIVAFQRFEVVTCNLGYKTFPCKPTKENLHMLHPNNQYAIV